MSTFGAFRLMAGSLLAGAYLLWAYMSLPTSRDLSAPDAGSRSRHPSRLGPPSDPPSEGRAE